MAPEEALKLIRTLVAGSDPEATTPRMAAILQGSVLELVRKGLGEPEAKAPRHLAISEGASGLA